MQLQVKKVIDPDQLTSIRIIPGCDYQQGDDLWKNFILHTNLGTVCATIRHFNAPADNRAELCFSSTEYQRMFVLITLGSDYSAKYYRPCQERLRWFEWLSPWRIAAKMQSDHRYQTLTAYNQGVRLLVDALNAYVQSVQWASNCAEVIQKLQQLAQQPKPILSAACTATLD